MLRSLRTFPLLDGYRGAARCDLAAIEDVLLRVSAMVETHPEIAELDCNPLIARPDGAVVVDARVRVEAAPPAAPLAVARSLPVADTLSALDGTFLELEDADDGALMHIGAVIVFAPLPAGPRAPTFDAVCRHLDERLGGLTRFRQRLSDSGPPAGPGRAGSGSPRAFDVADHVRVALPAPGSEAELMRLTAISSPISWTGPAPCGRWCSSKAWRMDAGRSASRRITAWSTALARSAHAICSSIRAGGRASR